jgi:uncharacterized protein YndB with AHSA1/START domain
MEGGTMIRSSITIDAPPEAVFEELTHVERHPTWANPAAEMTMEQVAGDGPGTDARYRSSGIFVKSAVTADISVKAYRPSTVFALRSDQHHEGKKDAWYEHTYTLSPQGSGTLLQKETDSSINPVVRFVAGPAIKKDAMTSLTNLKHLIESRRA